MRRLAQLKWSANKQPFFFLVIKEQIPHVSYHLWSRFQVKLLRSSRLAFPTPTGAAAPQLALLFTPLRSDPRHAPICLAHLAKALIELFAVFFFFSPSLWRGGNLFQPLPSQKKAAIASNFMQQSARRPRWTFELFTQGEITFTSLAWLSLAESHGARK